MSIRRVIFQPKATAHRNLLLLVLTLSIAVLTRASLAFAQDSLTLTLIVREGLSDYTTSFTDGGSGFVNTGALTFTNWSFPDGITAYSQPYQGDPTHDYLVINVPALSGTHPGELFISATETGFAALPFGRGSLSMLMSNTSVYTVMTGTVNNATVAAFSIGSMLAVTNLTITSGLGSTFTMSETIGIIYPYGSQPRGAPMQTCSCSPSRSRLPGPCLPPVLPLRS
ncbi:MAG TPA: hypothetical protein VMV72_00700 [Verrucomicrobiae bacterium]|nr:hypothetical protein [Verrucomicrobiae bacterium]